MPNWNKKKRNICALLHGLAKREKSVSCTKLDQLENFTW